jgi:4'-phosphopantetheinyl transferase
MGFGGFGAKLMGPMQVFYLTQDLVQMPADGFWLAESERIRAAGLRFPKRRNDWLLGRWTAKGAIRAFLTQEGKLPPGWGDLEIRSAPDGAPEAFDSGVSAPVSIALSHSGGKGFCVVGSPGQALGCDIELIQTRSPEFIEDYLTDEEQSLVTGAPSDGRPLWATLIWSAKESALKCLREGLRRDTRSVRIGIAPKHTPGWNPFMVECLDPATHFYGWWRDEGIFVKTIAAGMPVGEPQELLL